VHVQPLRALNADSEALLRARAEETGRDVESSLRDALAARKIEAVCLYDDGFVPRGLAAWRWADPGQVHAQVVLLYVRAESPPALSGALVDYVFSELVRVRSVEVIEARARDDSPGVRAAWQRHELIFFERCRMVRPLGVTPLPVLPVPDGYRLVRWQDEFMDAIEQIALSAREGSIDSAAVPEFLGDRAADTLRKLWTSESDRQNVNASWVVLNKRKQVSGYVAVSSAGREALIVDLAVCAPHRRRGLARLLMVRGLAVCQQAGISAVHLAVTTRNPARYLYNQLGFQTTDCGEVAIWWRDGRQLKWRE
jgi:ribosomal protein S18 acetylase RimI-like enzyme